MTPQLCCTKKLLTELRLSHAKTPAPELPEDPLQTWYADLFYFDGRKNVVALNEVTGYAAFLVSVTRRSLEELPEMLALEVAAIMEGDGFSAEEILRMTGGMAGIRYCRTASRSAVSHLNQYTYHVPFEIQRQREQGAIDCRQLAAYTNHGPFGPFWDPCRSLHEILRGLPPSSRRPNM